MMQHSLVLCGFMGCGKTTVGKALAAKWRVPFVDMDDYIEAQAGMKVSEIFERFGEEHFRALERDACKTLAAGKPCVVAAGGGALTFPENVRALREKGCRILMLCVRPETVLRRLEGDTTRPLLNRPDKEEAVRELLARRLPLYEAAAHFTVDANGEAPETIQKIEALPLWE
ncbi:MAG: shikimate kinase [Clostridiales bacterium]|nr:shikimate kinase [Clostridiales bacterium]